MALSAIPPVETLAVPVLGWYTVQFGGIQTSQILSVPNGSYLSSPDGVNPGLVGTADGALVHLAGLVSTEDGGQNWMMWVANSLAIPDKISIFNPNPSASTPGRWIVQLPTPPATTRQITSGATIQLTANVTLVSVRKSPAGPVTLLLPLMAAAVLGQTISISDANFVSSSYPITVTNLDNAPVGSPTSNIDIINQDGATRDYVPDGISWLRM